VLSPKAVYETQVKKTADIMPAGPTAYARAVELLRQGNLVALPTETVYGLAALASNDAAVRAIYDTKGRPRHNPLIVHIFNAKKANDLGEVSPLAQTLMNRFWPGSLTLVLPKKPSAKISAFASADLDTIAIRCPVGSWVDAFCKMGFQGPIVMPSANLSGHISPTTAQHVLDDLGDRIELIIDAGPCSGGVESTVLSIDGNRATLLRPGVIPVEAFVPFVSDLRLPDKKAKPIAPGMLESHYAPRAKLRLNATKRRQDEVFLGFGATDIKADMNLSETANLEEAARKLYACLRTLDALDKAVIAVAPIPMRGVGQAINDRLKRAAAPK